MEQFTFYQDRKITLWERSRFFVTAESYEKALEYVKSLEGEDLFDHEKEDVLEFFHFEILDNTSEYITVEENNGQATIEVLDRDCNVIYDNRKKPEIVSDGLNITIPRNDYVKPTEVREDVVQGICDACGKQMKRPSIHYSVQAIKHREQKELIAVLKLYGEKVDDGYEWHFDDDNCPIVAAYSYNEPCDVVILAVRVDKDGHLTVIGDEKNNRGDEHEIEAGDIFAGEMDYITTEIRYENLNNLKDKYRIDRDEYLNIGDTTLYRIIALKDFADVKQGDKGGWVRSEENLSQEGKCWIYDEAKATDDSRVLENAQMRNNSILFGSSTIKGYAKIHDYASMHNWSVMIEHAEMFGYSRITNCAMMYGNSKMYDDALMSEHSKMMDDSEMHDKSEISGNACLFNNSKIFNKSHIMGHVRILGDVEIRKNSDYFSFSEWWIDNDFVTWTRSNNMYSVKCLSCTEEQFIKRGYDKSVDAGKAAEKVVEFINNTMKG